MGHARESLELLKAQGEDDRACRMENQIACIQRHLGDYGKAAGQTGVFSLRRNGPGWRNSGGSCRRPGKASGKSPVLHPGKWGTTKASSEPTPTEHDE